MGFRVLRLTTNTEEFHSFMFFRSPVHLQVFNKFHQRSPVLSVGGLGRRSLPKSFPKQNPYGCFSFGNRGGSISRAPSQKDPIV